MNKKNYKLVVGLSITLVSLIVILTSYALWKVKDGQTGSNRLLGSCLAIDFEEELGDNDEPIIGITMEKAWPMSDEEGSSTDGYTFTVKNTCDDAVNYEIVLETIKIASPDNKMPDQYVKVRLDEKEIKRVSELDLEDNDSQAIYANTIDKTYKVFTGTVTKDSPKTHIIRQWYSSDAPSATIGYNYESKVKIYAGQGIEATNEGEGSSQQDDIDYVETYFLGEKDSQTGERPKNIYAESLLKPSSTNPNGYEFDDPNINLIAFAIDQPEHNQTLITVTYHDLTFEVLLNQETGYSEVVTLITSGGSANEPTVVGNNCTIEDIGCEVSIGNEHFYVLGQDETNSNNVKLLSKYNLLVGDEYSESTNSVVKTFTESDDGYNLQSSRAIGWSCTTYRLYDSNNNTIVAYTPETMVEALTNLTDNQMNTISNVECVGDRPNNVGVIAYYNPYASYWNNDSYGNNLKSQYGDSYPAFVYDENAVAYPYVNKYKDLLEETYNIDVVDARLMKFEEANPLAGNVMIAIKRYPWMFQTSYWTGTAKDYDQVYDLQTFFDFGGWEHEKDYRDGVRPVIVVAKSLFE